MFAAYLLSKQYIMGAIYGELRVGGHVFPILRCTYGVHQATDRRGRVIEKVRFEPVTLMLDVPRGDFLLAWAAAAAKRLPADVVFFDAAGGQAVETLSFVTGAYCVNHREEFHAGDASSGAYLLFLTLSDPDGFTMHAGGPGSTFVAPAARDHGTPPVQGFGNPTVVIPPSFPPPLVITPFEVPAAEGILAAAARVLAPLVAAPVLVPAALTLALILAASSPAHAPGITPLPVNPDELRLRELVARHAAGTLTADEEAELIALLAKVRGVHIQKLDDLNVSGPLRGNQQSLPGFHKIDLHYTKRSKADLAKLRGQFAPIRARFVKDLAGDPAKYARLKQAGLTDEQIRLMAGGNVPKGWRVHHKLPLDDTGDNRVGNLMLIEDDPWHLAITNYQNVNTLGLGPGQTVVLKWPMYDGYVYP